MKRLQRFSGRTLTAAFVLVVVAFIGSTLWVQELSRTTDADVLSISRDAAPDIEIVAASRAELRRQEALVSRAVANGGKGADELFEVRRRRDEELESYLGLPTSPAEAKLFAAYLASLRDFELAGERALEQARAGKAALAAESLRTEVETLADRADEAAMRLVNFDAQRARDAAVRIERNRTRVRRVALELDGVAALLAVLAAVLAMRGLRHYHALQDERRELMEHRAEELEQFAGRVAHDILSPLAAVGMALSIAERSATGVAKEALKRGGSSLGRVRRIVDGLLEFARAGARPEPGAFAEVQPIIAGLQEELIQVAAQTQAQLVVESVPLCAVKASPGVLISLLANLLRNAFKYLGDSPERVVTLRVQMQRGRVLFEVEDTGPGIPPALRERIFQPYVRGPEVGQPGIGLGLSTVKRLADSHGGAAGVRPAPRRGSLFWFELRAAGASAGEPGALDLSPATV